MSGWKKENMESIASNAQEFEDEVRDEIYKPAVEYDQNAVEIIYQILDMFKGVSDMFFNVETDFYDSAVGGLVGESRGKLVTAIRSARLSRIFQAKAAFSGGWLISLMWRTRVAW